jgi:NAD(P)H-hydrate epimerase
MKSGAGAGVLAFPATLKTLAQQKLESSTVLSYNDSGKEYLTTENLSELEDKIEWADSVILGPGLGRDPETVEAVLEIIKNGKSKKIIIDADALFALGGGEYQKLNLKGKILTPHHGEFAAVLGVDISELQKDLLNIGRKFAVETGCFLVLKGAPTIIFNPSGESFINSTGNPGMAKFGVGDVLSGMLGAFVAQNAETEEAIFSAVYIHSLTADLLLDEKTEYGITATDIMERIPDGINFLLNSFIQGD